MFHMFKFAYNIKKNLFDSKIYLSDQVIFLINKEIEKETSKKGQNQRTKTPLKIDFL